MFGVLDNTPLFILVYTCINSTKFPASSTGIVSESRFMPQVGGSARSRVRTGQCVSTVTSDGCFSIWSAYVADDIMRQVGRFVRLALKVVT